MSREPLVPIPTDRLNEMVGRPIHLRGANPGCVWILVSVTGELMTLRTPKTRRVIRSHLKNACYTRYWASRLAADDGAPSAPSSPTARG